MNGVQCAVILLSVVELALVNGTLDGFIDLTHFVTSSCTFCTRDSMDEIVGNIAGNSKFSP